MPLCRRLGIKTIVSMVHGDVREEQEVLEREDASSPEFMPIYLGSTIWTVSFWPGCMSAGCTTSLWLIACLFHRTTSRKRWSRHGTPAGKIRVIPYAADCRRFHPVSEKQQRTRLYFPLRGGISHRKGIKYLLEAWRRISTSWLAAPASRSIAGESRPARALLGLVEPLGRVSQSEMPATDGIGRCLRVSVAV